MIRLDKLINPYNEIYNDFLSDESKLSGKADYTAFPKSTDDICKILDIAREKKLNVTVQGSLTGITAGAVPLDGGIIINLSKMNNIGEIEIRDNSAFLDVAPGVILSDIRNKLDKENYFFTPDPTEQSASIGGMISSNASGAISYGYGSVRNWIDELEIVTPMGYILKLKRGDNFLSGNHFSIKTEDGHTIEGDIPNIRQVNVKSAAGLYLRPNMDIIDMFIGMEGVLGIITNAVIKAIKYPVICGLGVFFNNEDAALDFVEKIKNTNIDVVAIEFFNNDALKLLEYMIKKKDAFSDISSINLNYVAAVYLEIHSKEAEMDEQIEKLMSIIEEFNITDEQTWCGFSKKEIDKLKYFRHSFPESVNMLICEKKKNSPAITKLGTDMSVPDEFLKNILNKYNTELKKTNLRSVIFGHIGNNHLHVNIIPENESEYILGKKLYFDLAQYVVSIGGSISAEHGIGKIKKDFLAVMYSEAEINGMKKIKLIFDPSNILNKGNLFNI